jgi:hypothetical protein
VIVEVEPLLEACGESFSAPVARALGEAAALVRTIALRGASSLPRAPLGAVC